jgi:hypothetical protein
LLRVDYEHSLCTIFLFNDSTIKNEQFTGTPYYSNLNSTVFLRRTSKIVYSYYRYMITTDSKSIQTN